ncbi:MAG: type II toxin-antitoxin system HicB family antitoxin [Terriglobia bacterium]
MIDLVYSLVIEATDNPTFFAFHSPDLKSFTGVGNSIENCIDKARSGMEEHVSMLRELGFLVPQTGNDPKIVVQNSKITPYAWLFRIIFR